ncbi:hypothetical protein AGLY_016729 [Aphis glycines]|uniref:Uncharacterized protein n=1 Tax=Aphis glycines TaxID=307491 RepID=A0A6G0SWT6_APHGL|nr:hypothetical protein AGLY_016729 [Aphis glycines]
MKKNCRYHSCRKCLNYNSLVAASYQESLMTSKVFGLFKQYYEKNVSLCLFGFKFSSHVTTCPLYYIIRQNNDTAWHTLCACVTKKQYAFNKTIGVAIICTSNRILSKYSLYKCSQAVDCKKIGKKLLWNIALNFQEFRPYRKTIAHAYKYLRKTKSTFYALSKFFNSKVLSRRIKARLYVAVIRPILMYRYKTWIIISTSKRKLRKEKVVDPYNVLTEEWRRRYNIVLQDMLEIGTITLSGKRAKIFLKQCSVYLNANMLQKEHEVYLSLILKMVRNGNKLVFSEINKYDQIRSLNN